VYRLLKAHDLITSPAFIVMKAALTTDKDQRHRSRPNSFGPTNCSRHAGDRRPVIAFALCRIGASGFFILSQSRERPER
jgi:hypothetical protein